MSPVKKTTRKTPAKKSHSYRKKAINLDHLKQIEPLTPNQEQVFKSYAEGKNLVLHGAAGTGKTFISLYLALQEVLAEDSPYQKVYMVRSLVPTREIGFLPGDHEDKSNLYQIPYKNMVKYMFQMPDDNAFEMLYDNLRAQETISFWSTSFIRGVTMDDCIIIVDEFSNLNFHELDSIVTRVGENCKIIFSGDNTCNGKRTILIGIKIGHKVSQVQPTVNLNSLTDSSLSCRRSSLHTLAQTFLVILDMSPVKKTTRKTPAKKSHSYRKKAINLDHLKQIEPLTPNQEQVFKSYAEGKNLVLHGAAGTGKTFISLYLALQEVLAEDSPYQKVYMVRSLVPTREIGFLPGDHEDKSNLYQIPYKNMVKYMFQMPDDNAFEMLYDNLRAQETISFWSTSFIRGVTMDDCIIIVDEFSNLNFHELDSIVTRVGENCKIIFSGDYTQSDLVKNNEKNGVLDFMKIMQTMPSMDVVEFGIEDIVRSGFVKEYLISKINLGF